MELLLGNLNDEKELRAFDVNEALLILSQALLALQYLHTQGYAHRDLKPENILVQSRSPLRVKIADFGISQDISALLTICGTPKYRAPELWALAASTSVSQGRRKKRLVDKGQMYTTAVDIWALGVILAQLVYNQPRLTPVEPSNWPRSIINAMKESQSEPLAVFLRTHMLVEDYASRLPAEQCLLELEQIPEGNLTQTTY